MGVEAKGHIRVGGNNAGIWHAAEKHTIKPDVFTGL